MTDYLFVFRGKLEHRSPAAREEAWNSWFSELGAAVVDWGHRVRQFTTVGADRVAEESREPVTGFIIVKAENLDEAVGLASGCPILQARGAVEVGETSD